MTPAAPTCGPVAEAALVVSEAPAEVWLPLPVGLVLPLPVPVVEPEPEPVVEAVFEPPVVGEPAPVPAVLDPPPETLRDWLTHDVEPPA